MVDLPSALGFDPGSKLSMVRVLNKNAFPLQDRFDGTPFTFRPNVPEIIPPAAASHFFGYPGESEVMKAHTCRRFGWNRPDHIGADKSKPFDEMFQDGRSLADIYWSNIKIEPVNYQLVQEDLNMPDIELGTMREREAEGARLPSPDADGTHGGVGRKARKLDL